MELGVTFEDLAKPENISAKGGLIMNGRGRLTRLEDIEASLWDIPLDRIDANPNQPRVFFDEVKMKELKDTIGEMGQKVPLNVVPYQAEGSDEVRFLIVDGERRYRSLKELGKGDAKAIIEWYSTEREIYEASLIFNIDRAGHNPIELAMAFGKYIEYTTKEDECTKTAAIAKLADTLGKSASYVNNYLRLLDLDEEVQKMVMDGSLPGDISLRIVQMTKRLGPDKVDQARIARALLDHPEEDFDGEDVVKTGERGKRTGASIARERRKRLLMGKGNSEDPEVRKFIVDEAILRVHSRLTGVLGPLRAIKGFDEKDVTEGMKRKAYPIEATAEIVEEGIALLLEMRERIAAAVSPDALPDYPDKPSFTEFIKGKASSFGTDLRFRMAQLMGEASDKKTQQLSASEMAEALGSDSMTVTNNMRTLREELSALDLLILEGSKRVRESGKRASLTKVTAYRVDWKKVSIAGTPVPAPVPALPVVEKAAVEKAAPEAAVKPAAAPAPRAAAPAPAPVPAPKPARSPDLPPGARKIEVGYRHAYPAIGNDIVFVLPANDPDYTGKMRAYDVTRDEILVYTVKGGGKRIYKIEKDALAKK